jgi:hypothetical protein
MNSDCGCCEGVERVTPVSNENRPGLSALVYRAGTHATFLETMLARLTSQTLPPPVGDEVQTEGPRPLLSLKTRDAEDSSIAFLDAWATVADVLTFYQERIANEGYLRTATERRSVTELANLVGYRPRPGVSASTHLAYTLEDKAEVTILAGSRAASTPGPDELPQTFETAEDIYARAEWNLLTPRQSRPQPLNKLREGERPLYLKGTSTNLKPNDPILVDFGLSMDSLALFRVMAVEPDNNAKITKVTLRLWTDGAAAAPSPSTGGPQRAVLDTLKDIAVRYRATEDFGVNANTATAGRVLDHVDTLTVNINTGITNDALRTRLDDVLPRLREEHRLAREGGYTKLEPWIGGLVTELTDLYEQLPPRTSVSSPVASNTAAMMRLAQPSGGVSATTLAASAAVKSSTQTVAGKSSLSNVTALLGALTKEPSAQHRSRQQFASSDDFTLAKAFSPASDNLPRLLGAFLPALGGAIYRAWAAVPVTRRTPAAVYALRTRASAFGNTAPLFQARNPDGTPLGLPSEWTLKRSAQAEPVTRRFRVNVTYGATDGENAIQNYTARVDLLNNSGGVIDTASITRDIKDTATPLSFKLNEPVTLSVSGVESSDLQRVTYTFDFSALDARVSMLLDREQDSVHVTSTGSNPVEVDYDPAVARNAVFGTFPSMTAEGSVSVLGPSNEFTETAYALSLDATYNKILPGSFAVIERPAAGSANAPRNASSQPIIQRVERVGEVSRADYDMTAKGTQLQLDQKRKGWIDPADGDDFSVIRKANIFVESEKLDLAEEPIDPIEEAVCGGSIELGALISGLEIGRWMIVTGERTDVTQTTKTSPAPASSTNGITVDGVGGATGAGGAGSNGSGTNGDKNGDKDKDEKDVIAGLQAAELVMLSGIEQSFDPELEDDRTHTTLQFATPLAYCYKRDTVRIYGNVVRATHGETRTEVLGSGDASKPMQTFTLKQSPLTYISAPTASGVESTLKVRVNDVLWHETDTLAGLAPTDRLYVTKADEAGATAVIFGNGRQGARIPTGNENVKATYRAGIGKPGNLKAAQINQPTTKPLGVKGVVNPLAATGGADREGRDEARRNAPLAVTALDRLVSTRDYEDFARTFAGVAKASAARLSDGRRRVVHVTIAGADDAPISKNSDLYKNLREALHKFGDPFQPVELETRYLKTLFVSANVKVHPEYLWESVETKVRAALLERFSFDRRDLGQDALMSEAVAAAQGVEGVVYVDFDIFDDVAEGVSIEELLRVGEDLKLRSRVRAYLAHVESAAALGAASRIRPAQLVLLTPLVPDTLILKEIKR